MSGYIVLVLSVRGAESLSPCTIRPVASWVPDLADACIAVKTALESPQTIEVHVGLVEPH